MWSGRLAGRTNPTISLKHRGTGASACAPRLLLRKRLERHTDTLQGVFPQAGQLSQALQKALEARLLPAAVLPLPPACCTLKVTCRRVRRWHWPAESVHRKLPCALPQDGLGWGVPMQAWRRPCWGRAEVASVDSQAARSNAILEAAKGSSFQQRGACTGLTRTLPGRPPAQLRPTRPAIGARACT